MLWYRLAAYLKDSWPGVSMISKPGSLISVFENCAKDTHKMNKRYIAQTSHTSMAPCTQKQSQWQSLHPVNQHRDTCVLFRRYESVQAPGTGDNPQKPIPALLLPSPPTHTSLRNFVCSLMALSGTKVAPICCVIPPASPSCTLLCLIYKQDAMTNSYNKVQ